jgi:hypothetical protein
MQILEFIISRLNEISNHIETPYFSMVTVKN